MERNSLINKKVKALLRKKLAHTTLYSRVQKIQEECLTTKEDAANLLAAELGIPVYNFLSEDELAKLRELQKIRKNPPSFRIVRNNVEEKTKKIKIEKESITPNMLFDLMKFHPRIVRACKSQFKAGHYADAIFRAFRCIEVLVKRKAKLRNELGASLMHKVFNEKNPIIKLNDLIEEFEIDEQTGFRFIFAGAMSGIRNPKAHTEIEQKDPYRTLEYLSLASLLAKRVEEGIKV